MKIIVISDSHGYREYVQQVLRMEGTFDYLFHCGDGASDVAPYRDIAGPGVITVQGNMDLDRGPLPKEQIVNLDAFKMLVLHGHEFGVKKDTDQLYEYALLMEVDGVCFGHTHVQYYSAHPLFMFNPGALMDGYYGVVHFSSRGISASHQSLMS